MSLFNVFQISGSGMSAQSVRLNATSSNLANVDTHATSPEQAYKAKQPVFAAVMKNTMGGMGGVRVAEVAESKLEAPARYEPENPLADDNGFIYGSNVNAVEEMVNMISASRSYQANVEVMNTSKELLIRTIQMGS